MLTDDQITQLDNFCQMKGIYYYDLRMEVVDHLAASIEEKIINDSKLSFEEALQQVYSGFGVTGFNNIISERKLFATTSHKRKYKTLLLNYFSLPRILLSIGIVCTCCLPLFFIPNKEDQVTYSMSILLLPLIISVFTKAVFNGFLNFNKVKPLSKRQKKPLICVQGIHWTPFISLFLIYNVYRTTLFLLKVKMEDCSLTIPLFVSLGVLFTIFQLANYETRKKLYQQASIEYPPAFEK